MEKASRRDIDSFCLNTKCINNYGYKFKLGLVILRLIINYFIYKAQIYPFITFITEAFRLLTLTKKKPIKFFLVSIQ